MKNTGDRLIREAEVREKLGNPSKTTAYNRFYTRSDFPRPAIRLNYNLWSERRIDEFIAQLQREADAA